MAKAKIRPLQLAPEQRRMIRSQVGGLCYRIRNERAEILLVTTRGAGRWIIPKGWPLAGETAGASALQECWEEAGVVGTLSGSALGAFTYVKDRAEDDHPHSVTVFPVKVKRLEDKYPEAKQRRRKWFSTAKAAQRVTEPELRQMLAAFDPTRF